VIGFSTFSPISEIPSMVYIHLNLNTAVTCCAGRNIRIKKSLSKILRLDAV